MRQSSHRPGGRSSHRARRASRRRRRSGARRGGGQRCSASPSCRDGAAWKFRPAWTDAAKACEVAGMHENVCAGKFRHFLPSQLACVGFHGASLPRPCLLAWRVGVPCSRRAVLPVQPRGMRATLNLILSVAPTKHTYEFAKLSVRVRYTRVPALASARSGVHTRTALHSVSSRVLFQYGGGEGYGGGCRATCREGAELR